MMTFVVGENERNVKRSAWRVQRTGAIRAHDAPRPTHRLMRGFTLIELLLVLGLLILLLSLSVIGVDALRTHASLNEGAARFETVLRMARNDAAAMGRRLSVAFDGDSGAIELFIEADPWQAPGELEPYTGCMWLHQLPTDLVRVERSVLRGAAGAMWLEEEAGAEVDLQPITFYPDGSADSATVTLASRRERDTRRALVELDGLSNRIRTRIVSEAHDE